MPFTSRDVNDVAHLVSLKLETYINNERRELSFDPSGRGKQTTTWQYDGVNKMVPRGQSRWTERMRGRRLAISSSTDAIKPAIIEDTFRSVSRTEATSLIRNANKIFMDYPIDRLQETLAYKPTYKYLSEVKLPQNYTEHVGSCLRSRDYCDYYAKNGLGNKRPSVSEKPKLKEESREQPKESKTKEPKSAPVRTKTNGNNKEIKENRKLKGREKAKPERIKSDHKTTEKRYKSNNRSLMRLILDGEKTETRKTVDGDKTSKVTPSETTTEKQTNNSDTDRILSEANNEGPTRKESNIDSAFFEALYKV